MTEEIFCDEDVDQSNIKTCKTRVEQLMRDNEEAFNV